MAVVADDVGAVLCHDLKQRGEVEICQCQIQLE
jgi:hypothetical protein